MITKKQAYEAAMTLEKFCRETECNCDKCPFNISEHPFKNPETDCLLDNGISPDIWSEYIDIDRFWEE